MPRYHFNIYDGMAIPDAEGTAFDTWVDARTEAIRLCGEVLKDHPQRIGIGEDWRMEVTDEWGLVLFRLDFHVMESPALLGACNAVRPSQV